MGTLHVDVYNGTWINDVWFRTGQQQSSNSVPWLNAVIPLNTYGNLNNIKIRFRGTRGSGVRSDMAVDYVIVRQQGVSSPGGQPVDGEEIMNPPVVQSMIDDSQIEVFSYVGNLYFKNTGNDELKGRVDIYNITGQLVKSINISGSGNFQIASGLRPGLYIVRLKAGNQAISRKILVN